MRRLNVLLAALALMIAAPAAADIIPTPVKARLTRPEYFPAPGREFMTTVTLEAAREANVRNLEVSGGSWTVGRWDAPGALNLTAGQSVSFTLSATPGAGFGPLVLSAEVNGRSWQRTFDVSREAHGGIQATDSDRVPPRRLLPATGEKSPLPAQLTWAELASIAEAAPSPQAATKDGRPTCTVTGFLTYFDTSRNTWLLPYGNHVWAWLRSANGQLYSVGTQAMGADGHFAIEIPVDANFAIGFSATSSACVIQEDGIWEENYSWISTWFDPPAGAVNFHTGGLSPNSHAGALHICTDLAYTQELFDSAGWHVGQVDVQWPDGGEGASFYDPDFGELHFKTSSTWNDGTICHEWAHYFNDMHAHDVAPDYCNGICDDGDDCGHCGWCPENDPTSWVEGFAQGLSRIATDYIADVADFTPVHKDVDSYDGNSGCAWDPWNIEFVIGGAWWDLVDSDRGIETNVAGQVDALGRTLYDQLDLDLSDFLNILCQHCDVEGHEPYRAAGFYRCAYEYLDDLGDPRATRAQLWETAASWDLDTDAANPGFPTNITCSLPVGQPTSIRYAHFGWEIPWDDASGVCAYSVSLHQGTPEAPDLNVDITDNWYNSPEMTPGSWYFGVRSLDRSGRWSVPTYVGPITITAPGPSDLTSEMPYGWAAPLVARSTTVGDYPAPVTQPNFVQGHTVYFNWAGRNVGTGPTGNTVDHVFLDGTQVLTGPIYNVNAGVSFQRRDRGPVATGLYGRHTAWVKLDGQDAAAEPEEANNFYAKQFVFSAYSLDLDDLETFTTPLPNPTAGEDLLPGGTPFYPNCMGLRVDLCLYPELVWMAPAEPDNRLVARLHPYDNSQNGFQTPLMASQSNADTPAAVIQNPSETLMTQYAVGLSKASSTTEPGWDQGYRVCRELGQMFAMPDTLGGQILADDCLNFYYAYNDLDDESWFTIKVVNNDTEQLKMKIFEPGFAMGDLFDADVTVHVAEGDTSYYNVLLPPGEIAITVVSRDQRLTGTSNYTILAYNSLPDPAASTPANWFGNVVPQVGTPYYADSDPIPAPTALTGGTQSTGVYWSLKNLSPEAGIPIGLRHEVRLDGVHLFSGTFIEPLLPEHQVKAVHTSLVTVRGGRHALTHLVNGNNAIDEDDWTNNRYGRQWVWSPQTLAANTVFSVPAPPSPFGGLTQVTDGIVATNCNGYRPTVPGMPNLDTIVAVYATDDETDVDLGIYTGSGVQDGYTEEIIMSQWSGAGCDFVLRVVPAHGFSFFHLGAILGGGLGTGNVTLATKTTTDVWTNPVDNPKSGTVEAAAFLDAMFLDLPAGVYRFTLRSHEADLGVSLHDLSGLAAAKTEPWQDGIAWQTPDLGGADVSFVVSVPDDGAPTAFGLVVWRPDGASAGVDTDWQVTVSEELVGVDDDELPAVLATASRLVSATPNPFNPQTEVAFDVARAGRCTLTLHDVRGRLVRTLADGDLPVGRHAVQWNGLDDRGERASSGTYIARLRTAGGETDLLKLTLVK